jgi:hypothetical protein
MRPLLKYGVPAAAGLATGGYALSQGEDPGSAVLAGLAGGAGAAGGLLASRQLAGKYAPALATTMQESVVPLGQKVRTAMAESEPGSLKRKMLEKTRNTLAQGYRALDAGKAEPYLGQVLAAGLVPASAGLAGLGGIAAGAIPGALGIPGFNQNVITDPELVGSSNTQMARTYTPTLKYIS